MTNVVEFNPKRSFSKELNDAKDFLMESISEIPMPPTIKDALLNLPHAFHMKNFESHHWAMLALRVYSEPDVNNTYVSLQSTFREDIYPDFGIKEGIDFVVINYGYSDNPPEESKEQANNLCFLHQEFLEKFIFDRAMNVSHMLPYRALLKYLVELDRTIYVGYEKKDHQFNVALAEKVEGHDLWLHYGVTFNASPMILDHCAFLQRKSREDQED